MFEDFRKQMDDASTQDEAQEEKVLAEQVHVEGMFLGMTPVQRFIIALMLLLMTLVIGILFLLVTSKIVPPFMQ